MVLEGDVRSTVRVVRPSYLCPCSTPMKGAPHVGSPWVCGANHTFAVTEAGIDVKAKAITGAKTKGVIKGTVYIWTPNATDLEAPVQGRAR